MKLFFLLLVLVFWGGGCTPIISYTLHQEVDKDLSLLELFKTPNNFVGKTFLIGLVIIRFDKTKKRLLAFQVDLDVRLKPIENDKTLGRVLIIFDEPIDEDKFKNGAKLTFVGKLLGIERLPIHQTFYNYLVLKPIEYYLW